MQNREDYALPERIVKVMDIAHRIGMCAQLTSIYVPKAYATAITGTIGTEHCQLMLTDEMVARAVDPRTLFEDMVLAAFHNAAEQAGVWQQIQSWRYCPDCDGDGYLSEGDDKLTCEMCQGLGGWIDL
jgi:NADH pyrophosphatase NudC (nudix superfamily)